MRGAIWACAAAELLHAGDAGERWWGAECGAIGISLCPLPGARDDGYVWRAGRPGSTLALQICRASRGKQGRCNRYLTGPRGLAGRAEFLLHARSCLIGLRVAGAPICSVALP